MNELAERFHKLFEGTEHAHGECEMLPTKRSDGLKKRVAARTVKEAVTNDLWSDHLDGRKNIGIIPVQQSMLCCWGAIDIDGQVHVATLAAQIGRLNLPLVACRSKSGGAHLYLFSEAMPAEQIQDELRYCAKRLGFPHAEVFPKQTKILFDRGDVGSWILMPYFNAKYPDRYAVDSAGKILTAVEFVELAESRLKEL